MDFGDLKTYTRQRCGIEENGAIQDDELGTYLNMALGSLDVILCTDYEDYRLTTYLATIGNNQGGGAGQGPNNTIPLPPDFFKLRGVDFGAPGAWITLYGLGLQQRNRFNSPYSNMFSNYGNQVARKVRVVDNVILVEPLNLCSGQYQVWYTPKFVWLVNDTDTLPLAMDTEGFVEYAVCAAGVKIYNKLVLPTASFMEEMKYYEEVVRNGAKNRMNNGPQCVQNVRNQRGGFINRGGWG